MYGSQWFYTNFKSDFPSFCSESINTLELLTVIEGVRRWGHLWKDCHIKVQSDNTSTVTAINKGTSKCPSFMRCLRFLFWLSIKYGFRISACHIAGKVNIIPDMISRLHMPSMSEKFYKMFHSQIVNCFHNMTLASFLTLQASHQVWMN